MACEYLQVALQPVPTISLTHSLFCPFSILPIPCLLTSTVHPLKLPFGVRQTPPTREINLCHCWLTYLFSSKVAQFNREIYQIYRSTEKTAAWTKANELSHRSADNLSLTYSSQCPRKVINRQDIGSVLYSPSLHFLLAIGFFPSISTQWRHKEKGALWNLTLFSPVPPPSQS